METETVIVADKHGNKVIGNKTIQDFYQECWKSMLPHLQEIKERLNESLFWNDTMWFKRELDVDTARAMSMFCQESVTVVLISPNLPDVWWAKTVNVNVLNYNNVNYLIAEIPGDYHLKAFINQWNRDHRYGDEGSERTVD